MKFSKVKTVSICSISPIQVEVEAHVQPGIPSFTIVGLGDKAIAESKDRVRSALFSSGFSLPLGRIVVNLSPASVEKHGTHYDLPIAMALLSASGYLSLNQKTEESIVLGELSLDGNILSVSGVLPAAIFAEKNQSRIICGKSNYEEARTCSNNCIVAGSLLELIEVLSGKKTYHKPIQETQPEEHRIKQSFNGIYGQELGRRALKICAAARHHLLLEGPHGVGKTTIATAIEDLVPPLSQDESLEVSSIYSVCGMLGSNKLLTRAPFRAPHSSSSLVAVVGGGTVPKPGEVTLAHRGTLFLDELPEFQPAVIDSLRTILEEKAVSVSRAKYKIDYPADFCLIVSMNPCKCGNRTKCKCGKGNYRFRVSAPIQDRIDMRVVLSQPETMTCLKEDMGELRQKIKEVREFQRKRFGCCNADLGQVVMEENRENLFSNGALSFLDSAKIFGRNYVKVLRLALTIADLEGRKVEKNHVAEALFLRGTGLG